MEINKLVRKNILALKPYSSARDEFERVDEILLDANENPYESEVNRYPDPYQRTLKKAISKIKGVNSANIFLGNGSDEAIDILLRIFCEPGKDEIIIPDPTYGMYQVSAAINNVNTIKIPLSKNFELDPEDVLSVHSETTKLLFICSPNNPSGNSFKKEDIVKLIENFDGMVVLDEAYCDFSEQDSMLKELSGHNNLIILQTMSKAWGMAGLRLGMAFASTEIIKLMNKVKPPYNINTLSQKMALKALGNIDQMRKSVTELLKQRNLLNGTLNELPIINKVFPSDANFLLVRFSDAQSVYKQLIKKGIVVRDRTTVLHGENCLRLTIGTSEENQTLIKALNSII